VAMLACFETILHLARGLKTQIIDNLEI